MICFTTLLADVCSLHVNCGGDDFIAEDDNRMVTYEGDGGVQGGIVTYFRNKENYWGFSSTGDFMDDADLLSIRHITKRPRSNLSDLYTTARISPITLTYFAYCLKNGNYSVKLHFAEIEFTNDRTYNSLGRRVFDIYIQVLIVNLSALRVLQVDDYTDCSDFMLTTEQISSQGFQY